MFSTSSFRFTRARGAVFGGKTMIAPRQKPVIVRSCRRLATTTTTGASNKASGASTNPTTTGRIIPISKQKNNFKMAAAFSGGLLVICSLDFVAPREWPFTKNDNNDKTFWSDKSLQATKNSDTKANDKNNDNNHKQRPQLTENMSCKVVIIGGGMAGLHTALALSERQQPQRLPKKDDSSSSTSQRSIIILDAGRIGQSASGKSKGLVVPGIQVPQEDLANKCGSPEVSQTIYQLTHQALLRLKHDVVQKYKIDCDWVDAGMVEASLHEEEDDEANHNNNNNNSDSDSGDGCRALTAAQVRNVLGQPESSTLYKCGEYDPSCSGVDPLVLTRGLANAVEQYWGVQIFENSKATKIERISNNISKQEKAISDGKSKNPHKYIVTTENGAQIQCQHVVLCTGPELVSKALSKRLSNAIIPIYTWMASTVPLGDQCPLQGNCVDETKANVDKKVAPLCGDDHVCLNYWRRTDDGRLLFGSLADAYPTPRWLAEYRLRQSLRTVYPQLANVPFDHVWGGTLAFSRDAVPLIGRDEGFDNYDTDSSSNVTSLDGGVWYATGFGGHGIVPTVMAGSIIADGILGIDDKTWRLFQREFPPRFTFWPLSRLGAEMTLLLYTTFDWLHVKGIPVPRLPKPW